VQVDLPVKRLLIVLVLVVLALAGGVYALGHTHLVSDRLAAPSEVPKVETPFPVLYGQLLETVTGTGLVAPQESLLVSTEQSGRVVKLLHDANDTVSEGDELLQLDDRVAQHKLQQAQATLATARSAVESAKASAQEVEAKYQAARRVLARAQEQNRLGNLSREVVDDRQTEADVVDKGRTSAAAMIRAAEARAREAEEAVALAELGLKLTHVTVPVVVPAPPREAGSDSHDLGSILHDLPSDRKKRTYTILERKVSLNQLVGPPVSGQLFVLTPSAKELQVNAQIAESDIHRVDRGMKVYFTVSAYENHYFVGTVTEVKPLPTVQSGSTYYTAVVTVERAPGARDPYPLKAGMTTASLDVVTRHVPANEKEGVWMVPDAAVNFPLDRDYWAPDVKEAPNAGDAQKFVWITDENRTTGRPLLIKTGATGKVLDEAGTGLRSETYTEIKEWGTGAPPLTPGKKSPFEVITGAPPSKKAGGLKLPSLFKS
jgi:multidrug efflux pump subunit AcrA (membrane-fusion protein)